MVTKNDLLAPFEKGPRLAAERVIGAEYEKLLVDYKTGLSIPWDGKYGIEAVMKFFSDSFGWEPYEEEGVIIALKRNGQCITLEPGGQFEMSGAPVKSLREVKGELDNHLEELGALSESFPVRVQWLGLNSRQTPETAHWMPKPRYRTMRRYMPTVGTRGLQMMALTCTVQVNLDITSQEDFAFKMKLGTRVGPLITALFANSPIMNGAPSGFQSWRAHVWHDVDNARCGMPRFVFDTDCGFEDYANWALDVPMYFVKRHHRYVDIAGKGTFRHLMAGRISGHHAEPEDWQLHLSTLFPDVRARPHLEFRQADVVPPEAIVALPALCKGFIYDEDAAQAAWDLVKRWSYEDCLQLSRDVAKHAVRASRPGTLGTVQGLCAELVRIAQWGLERQVHAGLGDATDTAHLDVLHHIAASGETFADKTLAAFAAG